MAERRRGKAGGTAVAESPATQNPPASAPDQEAPPADNAPDDSDDVQGDDSTALANRNVSPDSGQKIILRTAGAAFTLTQALLPANASYNRAEMAYTFSEGMRESSKWWQGDIINFVKEHHDQKFSQLANATGQDEGSLKNVSSIAAKFAPSRRRAGISWSHHAAVASLPEEVADKLLEEAEASKWSVVQVRAEAREWREEHGQGSDNGQSGDDDTQPTPAVATSQEPRGVAPVDPATLPEDDKGWKCPNCPDLRFAEGVWHCLICGAHNPAEDEECSYCPAEGEDNGETTTATETAPQLSSGAVSGQIITPGDQSGVTIEDLVHAASVRTIDVRTAVSELRENPDNFSALMGLHEWLGRLLETASETAPGATEAQSPGGKMAGQPAPKPSSGKRTRKPKTAAPAAVAQTEDGPDDDPDEEPETPETEAGDDLDNAFS